MGWRADRVDYADVIRVRDALGCPEVMAWALVRRGLGEPEAAREFLTSDGPLDPPTSLDGVTDAAERLINALRSGEHIAIHGDYDCDGVCSTATLAGYLRARGGTVTTFLPSRFRDGYGVSTETVNRIADSGATVLVCVDCGATAVEPLERAVERGMSVIVLDHHLAAGLRPPGIIANPALGPEREDAPAAVGVVFMVVRAMAELDPDGLLSVDPEEYVDLAALATVADAVPLVGQNRRLVARGLEAIRRSPRPGIKALCRAAGIDHRGIQARHLGFSLAPSINAAGRLTEADEALQLVMAQDVDEALPLAERLWALNVERRDIERRITDEATLQIEALPDELRDAAAILAIGDEWHEGVVGIVASRLVDRFEKPAIVLSRNGDTAKGSGRSLAGVDLHDLVARSSGRLIRWGGHAGAVGLELATDDIDAFRREFLDAAAGIRGVIERARMRQVDVVVGARDLTLDTAEALGELAPFGRGNPSVRLLLPGCRAESPTAIGQGRHLETRLVLGGAHTRAVGFSQGHRASSIGAESRFDAHVSLGVDTFRDVVGPKVVIERLENIPDTGNAAQCGVRCDLACGARRGLSDIRSAVGDASSDEPVAPTDPIAPPRSISDLRGTDAGLPRMISLAGADAGVAVMVVSVPLRRAGLEAALAPRRVGVEALVLAGKRCDPNALHARIEAVGTHPSVLVLEHGLSPVPDLPDGMHLLVLDPPSTAQEAEQVRRLASGRHLHLAWGEAEVDLALQMAEQRADVRGQAAALWRALRNVPNHPWGADLEARLLGDAAIMRDPVEIAGALAALAEIGLIAIGEDALRVHADATPRSRIDDTVPARAAAARLEAQRAFLARAQTLDILLEPAPAGA